MDCDYKADDDADEYDYDYIFIRKDVTINGNNHIIDGNNRTRVFMVEDGYSLTLNNLTIINARADSGAGVYLKYNASLTINNVNFINNYAHDQKVLLFTQVFAILLMFIIPVSLITLL